MRCASNGVVIDEEVRLHLRVTVDRCHEDNAGDQTKLLGHLMSY